MSSDGAGLTVTILGCSGSYAAAGGACSGYLLRSAGATVWLDAGPGTLGELQRHCALADLDAIVLSHAHPDHWLELPVLANALGWYVERPTLPVYANAAVFESASLLTGEDSDSGRRVFDWREVNDTSTVEIGDQTWNFRTTDHYVPTLASRTECDGRVLVYTADTGPAWSLTDFDAPITTALCESTFRIRAGHEAVQHLSAGEAATMAKDAGVEQLLLTHLAPGEVPAEHYEAARAEFDGKIAVVERGATYAA